MRMKTSAIGLLVIAVLAVACRPLADRLPAERETTLGPLVWPQPPHQPRIRFVRAVTDPVDLGIQPSLWERLVQVLAGKEENGFVRPTGVAADGHLISVADPGAQALWILNPQAGRFQRVQQIGEQRLISPVAVTFGSKGRIYLADSYFGKVFVLSADGKLQGTIIDANLRRPAGVAYDKMRDLLYVADSATHRIWIFDDNGRRVGVIGQRGTANGEFNFPTHIALDRDGTLYVTDALGFRVQIFNPDGRFAGQFGRHGDSSGDFSSPKGVAIDSEGHIYVVEALFDAVQIFDRSGRYLLTFGERGIKSGQFWLPNGIFIDGHDRIYVADAYNQRIQVFQYLVGGSDG